MRSERPRPSVRRAGSGPTVLCLHSNASSSAQWRALSERLAPHRTVIAADSWNAGRSPTWAASRPPTFDDEVDLIEPLLLEADGPVDLVGHSFGGAIALRAALRHPTRVRSIAAYEPTAFWLVAASERPGDVQGIADVAVDASAAVERGDLDAAAQRFVDFWNGPGAWARTPPERRDAPLRAIRFVGDWGHATLGDSTPLDAFAALRVPVLLLSGEASPLSGQAPAALLARTLPDARLEILAGLGHMGPVTHPDPVNARLERFLLEPRA
jgi:pimeloyl-ACP methyl ester carboxylesterase